jgi:hypothetical protein
MRPAPDVGPDSAIAPLKSLSSRPLYARICKPTEIPPLMNCYSGVVISGYATYALSPHIVTFVGSPPKAGIFSCIQCKANLTTVRKVAAPQKELIPLISETKVRHTSLQNILRVQKPPAMKAIIDAGCNDGLTNLNRLFDDK